MTIRGPFFGGLEPFWAVGSAVEVLFDADPKSQFWGFFPYVFDPLSDPSSVRGFHQDTELAYFPQVRRLFIMCSLNPSAGFFPLFAPSAFPEGPGLWRSSAGSEATCLRGRNGEGIAGDIAAASLGVTLHGVTLQCAVSPPWAVGDTV